MVHARAYVSTSLPLRSLTVPLALPFDVPASRIDTIENKVKARFTKCRTQTLIISSVPKLNVRKLTKHS